jgi:hypothetical protein
MRKTLILFTFTCCLFAAQAAQGQSSIEKYNLTTTAWANKYQMDEGQQAQALKIAQRKELQLVEIESLLATQPKQYYARLDAIQKGTLISLQKLFNSPEQKAAFDKTQMEVRKQRAQLKKELRAKGSSKAEIEQQLIRLHAE